jgi:hypothetical protein
MPRRDNLQQPKMRADTTTILIGALILWQFYATILVALSKHWDLHQKLLHIGIIWALPLLGALYARFALNAAERNALEQRAKQAKEQPPRGA